MSILPIEHVRGEHLVDRDAPAALPPGPAYAGTPALLAAAGEPVRLIQHRMLLDRPVAELQTMRGATRLFDAVSAAPLPALSAAQAEAIARAAYKNAAPGKAAVTPVTATSTDYKGALPAWRIAFDDDEATRVYVAAASGRIAAVRTRSWRLYDFFWGLHIMDWKNHEDFNTPWLIGFAIGGLGLAIAGCVLLYLRWPRRRRRARAR